jgi:AhpD family alkylhydroperoxidase
MARIPLIGPESAIPEVKEIYEKTLRGKPGNAQKALAHRPEMLKNFLPFYASVGRSLDRKLYELIYLRVSFINGCHYCAQHHVSSSKRAGLTAEDWSALKAGNYSPYGEKERVALSYVEKLTRAPHDITTLTSPRCERSSLNLKSSIFICSQASPISPTASPTH